MSIFDCHLHFFSRDFFAAMVRQKNPAAEVEQVLGDLAQRAKIEIPPSDVHAHLEGWLAELDRHGVERAVTFASLPEEAAAIAEATQHSGNRLIGFCKEFCSAPIPACSPAAGGKIYWKYKNRRWRRQAFRRRKWKWF